MRIFRLISLLIGIIFLSCSLEGCLVAAVGAGVAAVKYGNAKKSEALSKQQHAYNQYVLGMQEINIKREKTGLNPQPIMPFEQYCQVNK